MIGTAGHIDHGKTALVRVLTGVDTDRLAEEKARGITIDLGFAPLELGGVPASVVDVPGHEDFVRNMVAGATGVDVALLVVAADEGVMPQTREHLAILRFLGVDDGVVALTKCDIAPDESWRELVAEEVGELLAAEMGAAWPVCEVSSVTGQGMDRLRALLAERALGVRGRPRHDVFRMPVDRVFALPGAGTIATGTVWSGSVAEGDRVTVLPSACEARLRSVQVHGRAASAAEPGRRAALALVGCDRTDAGRGSVVVAGNGWRTTKAFEASVALLPSITLRPRDRVRVHHGTAEVMARVSALGAPGGSGRAARLALEEPLVLRSGDRFVVRSFSPVTTIGGGTVTEPWLDALPRRRRGGRPALPPGSDSGRLSALIRRRGPWGMRRAELHVASGMDEGRMEAALAGLEDDVARSGDWLVAEEEVGIAAARLRAALEVFHARNPLEPGMPAEAWRAEAGPFRPLAELAEARLVADGLVGRSGGLVHRPDWRAGEDVAAREGRGRILAALAEAGSEPPTVAELQATQPDTDVRALLRMLAREGAVVALSPDRYYEAGVLDRERRELVAALEAMGEATPAALRERLGKSRKWLIPLLEWADREGLTVREGDRRRLRAPRGGA